MDESSSIYLTYNLCCLVIAINLAYLITVLIKLSGDKRSMTDKQAEIPTQPRTTTATVISSTSKFGSERLAQLYPHVSDDTPLPSKWNSKDKAPTLVLQQNNLVVTYKGNHRMFFRY